MNNFTFSFKEILTDETSIDDASRFNFRLDETIENNTKNLEEFLKKNNNKKKKLTHDEINFLRLQHSLERAKLDVLAIEDSKYNFIIGNKYIVKCISLAFLLIIEESKRDRRMDISSAAKTQLADCLLANFMTLDHESFFEKFNSKLELKEQ